MTIGFLFCYYGDPSAKTIMMFESDVCRMITVIIIFIVVVRQ